MFVCCSRVMEYNSYATNKNTQHQEGKWLYNFWKQILNFYSKSSIMEKSTKTVILNKKEKKRRRDKQALKLPECPKF